MSKKRQRKPITPVDDATDKHGFQHFINIHVDDLRARNYSELTIDNRSKYVRRFALWCLARGITRPNEITKPILERFQRHLYQHRTEQDKPLSFRSQYAHLSSLRAWFKWLARKNYLLFNPASELDLPKLGHRLPKAVLTANEAEQVLATPNITEPLGVRDRAILETFYSTGIRRGELAGLRLDDIDAERRTIMIRLGKGKKDRIIPIGKRALSWITVYIESARGELLAGVNEPTLFLTNEGEPINPDSLTEYVRRYIDDSGIGKRGSCHLFRHTMATLMLEHGADIRYIQAMLGHAKLTTTEIYTQVSIRKLRQIHELTHPADHDREEPDPDDLKATGDDSDAAA
ncbi:integrase/recombinase XerD [Synechococcus sp. Ace-Pa]|uniref:site-specific tyrosine recombinase XerC n=1 Tax=Synechococcus sp. Ace-Pa TaxID=2572902 RepID=UPI0011A25AC9|nr:site-specific tyrosine recombinase XerC [Synechococcus sp. Ace-Pa]TWB87048.1 integrase/recombinase XerD [Synechococcus sp. Ace-Pa]